MSCRPARRWLDPVAVTVEVACWAWSVAAGRFAEANGPRLRLRDLGVVILFQPGLAEAAREAADREAYRCA